MKRMVHLLECHLLLIRGDTNRPSSFEQKYVVGTSTSATEVGCCGIVFRQGGRDGPKLLSSKVKIKRPLNCCLELLKSYTFFQGMFTIFQSPLVRGDLISYFLLSFFLSYYLQNSCYLSVRRFLLISLGIIIVLRLSVIFTQH